MNTHTCDSKCLDIDTDKKYGNCNFHVGKKEIVTRFTSIGLVDMLNSLAYHMAENMTDTQFIDMDATIVTCTGKVITFKAMSVDSQLVSMKSMYDECIDMWIDANRYMTGACDKLRSSKIIVANCQDIDELFTRH